MRCRYKAAAHKELLEAAQWYLAEAGVAVTQRLEMAVTRALSLLEFMPHIGTPAYPSVRLWPLRGFPYTLVYRVQGDVITVMAVAHQSRGPGYWQGRHGGDSWSACHRITLRTAAGRTSVMTSAAKLSAACT